MTFNITFQNIDLTSVSPCIYFTNFNVRIRESWKIKAENIDNNNNNNKNV
jgi:hypothetical protein